MTTYTPLSAGYGAFALTGADDAATYGRTLLTDTTYGSWGVFSLTGRAAGVATSATVSEGWLAGELQTVGLGVGIVESPLFGAASSSAVLFGPAVADALGLNDLAAFGAAYSRLISEGVSVSAALQLALAAACHETLTLSQTTQLALAITVVQTLFLGDTQANTLKFNLSVAEAVLSDTAFGGFLGVEVAERAQVVEALSPLWRFNAALLDGVTLADLAGESLLIRVTLAEDATFDDATLLQCVFAGNVSEDVSITAGYVAPSGVFTAWAINTRTTAITEYQNFAFDSLIQFGRKSLGANANGLYELDGDTDAGAPIVADLLSGFMQLGGAHFKAFKAAYFGVRTPGGEFVLKLITGEGATYVYTVTAHPMRSTRVNFGKGLRHRYFRFELQNIDGADFNLDNVEFIPLVSQRRI